MTKSTVTFIERGNLGDVKIVKVYQQFDGYPDGVGKELSEWLAGKKIVDGFSSEMDMPEYANGVCCLAAQFVHDFKKHIGGLYLVPVDENDSYVSYQYYVIVDLEGRVFIKMGSYGEEPGYEYTPAEFLEAINNGLIE